MSEKGLEAEFHCQEGVFWRVIGALARQGYVVPPSDGRDLIHDFYVDAWNGVLERFDPALGSFVSYLSSSFYRFARRKIIKIETISARLVELDLDVEQLSVSDSPQNILENVEDVNSVTVALSRLTPMERDVLEDYLSSHENSERHLAVRHSLTRYALRELLVDSIGKVAVCLNEVHSTPSTTPQIVELLWKRGVSPRNVANLLGIPVAQVQTARNRFVHTLLASMRSTDRSATTEKKTMSSEPPLEILRNALSSPNNTKSLDSLRSLSPRILEALDSEDLSIDADLWSKMQENPEWVAEVYEALSGDRLDEESSELLSVIHQIRSDEETEIGEAFVSLLDGLPTHFIPGASKKNFFSDAKLADNAYKLELNSRRSVLASGAAATPFVTYGLTPDSVYSATRALSLLFNRKRRSKTDPSSDNREEAGGSRELPPVAVTFGDYGKSVFVSQALILSEVASTPDLPLGLEFPLTVWLLEALRYKPLLIEGYVAEFEDSALVLQTQQHARDGVRGDLVARWAHSRDGSRHAQVHVG